MTVENRDEIDLAVASCLNAFDPIQTPIEDFSAFADSLKADSLWTERDRAEIKTRLLQIILHRKQHSEIRRG